MFNRKRSHGAASLGFKIVIDCRVYRRCSLSATQAIVSVAALAYLPQEHPSIYLPSLFTSKYKHDLIY